MRPNDCCKQEESSESPFVFDLCTYEEEESGQNLDKLMLDMVLETEALAAPHGVIRVA